MARLLTGQTARTTLTVQPRPGAIALRSGGGQSAIVGAALAQPIVVRVTGADGLAVQGVTVDLRHAVRRRLLRSGQRGHGRQRGRVHHLDPRFAGRRPDGDGERRGRRQRRHRRHGDPRERLAPGLHSCSRSTTTAGTAIAAVQVAAQDVFGNLYPSFTGTVTVALGANPGGATLSGTTAVAAVAGVATFSGLSLDKSGAGYTLVASASGLTSATSAGFPITAAAPATLALASGGSQTAAANAQLPQPVVVKVADAFGNGVSGRQVTFAVATRRRERRHAGRHDRRAAAWRARSGRWAPSSGAQTITATATGLAGSPLTVTATATGGVASTTVTPQLDTLTALGRPSSSRRRPRTAAGANVTGSFTWVSRTPAVATVSAAGPRHGGGERRLVRGGHRGGRDEGLGADRGAAARRDDQRDAGRAQHLPDAQLHASRRRRWTGGAIPIAGQLRRSPGRPRRRPSRRWTPAGHVTGGGARQRADPRARRARVTGVANVSVLTPITRIAVVVDTVGAADDRHLHADVARADAALPGHRARHARRGDDRRHVHLGLDQRVGGA